MNEETILKISELLDSQDQQSIALAMRLIAAHGERSWCELEQNKTYLVTRLIRGTYPRISSGYFVFMSRQKDWFGRLPEKIDLLRFIDADIRAENVLRIVPAKEPRQ